MVHLPLLILLLVPQSSALADEPVGMIVHVAGQVQLQHRFAPTSSARLADFLYTGDQVTTAFGNATILFCPSSETISAKDDSTLEVQARNVRLVKGPAPLRQKAERCPLLRVALGSESVERIGGLRARGYPPIPIYTGGTIASVRPTFEWAGVDGAQSFRLTLSGADGAPIWQYQLNSARVVYPESQPPLAPGRYEWEIRAESNGKTIASQSAGFEVKPRSFSTYSVADDAIALLRAAELEQAGYFAEAAALFRKLKEQNPADPRIRRHLAWLYWNAGLPIAAEAELKN